jgi:hypothetical protein
MEGVCLDKESIGKLSDLVGELQLWIESLELASDPEFVESMKRSEEQIKNGEVGNWDDL